MRVLIALDDTAESLHAAHQAVRLLEAMPDVHYLVINVTAVPIAWADMSAFGTVMPLTALPPLSDPQERDAAAREQLAQHAAEAAIPTPEVLQASGDAATEICSAADSHDVDLIVIGVHHKGILQRLLEPSVTAKVLKNSNRPVLVVAGQ